MAGGPYASAVACWRCCSKAIRTIEGTEDDCYRCALCGHEVGVEWRRPAEKPCWPLSPEDIVRARAFAATIARSSNKNEDLARLLDASRRWFQEARFGLFVHWGIYSIPAGRWNGTAISWLGEWIMHTARIPIREYEKLATRFNPERFNAREWVALAQDAGMRYIVFTAKHHDGFAMFHSQADPFNIVDATPFKRDPVAELAEACSRTGLRLALYYSQVQDWHEPHGGTGRNDGGYGNTWDFPPGTIGGFDEYLHRKVWPQVTELLTRYGPIAMMWFDNPLPSFTRAHAESLKTLVRSLQPSCLISSRIGHGLGDIRGFGDNELPTDAMSGPAEACVTMNDTWGFKHDGGRWKSGEELLGLRRQAITHRYNLLLNVGPMADGAFPPQAIERLELLARHKEQLPGPVDRRQQEQPAHACLCRVLNERLAE
jgi:alpha-L-fucosidase